MKQLSPQNLQRRLLPLLLALAVLGTSLPSASAIGKRGKSWKSKSVAEKRETPKSKRIGIINKLRQKSASKPKVPTANVASSTTKPRKKLFSRLRDRKPATTTAAKPKPKPTTQPQTVRVRATATATTPTTKKRERLLTRIFKPDPDLNKKRSAPAPTANVAAARKKQRPSGPVAPNSVQAPPKYNSALLSQAKSRGSNVVINIATQRAKVYVGGQVALDTPVSTARAGKRTPRGTFSVGQRVRQGKISTIYKVEMPYWMRLGQSAYGMHAGYLPGYPASAGCIRMPYQAAQKMYDATGYGTRVRITGG